jgi:hypothetical protein
MSNVNLSETAPTQFQDIGGVSLAYRHFGKEGAPLVACFQHFTGTMNNFDPIHTIAVVRFSTFPTLSCHNRTHPIQRERRLKLPIRAIRARMQWLTYSAKIRFNRGAAKSRKARTLIGRNRLAVYTRLTGCVAGWNSSSRVVKAPRS